MIINNARGSHTSPGIYSKEQDVTYSVKSLGITSLGLAGETVKGPAFETIKVEKWSEFEDYFGSTSPEKFKGTGFPKYELPYIAKEYLKESKQLYVCRVLGLSGYDAGKAWVVTATVSGADDKLNGTYAIAVLRSKGTYDAAKDGGCSASSGDKFTADVTGVTIKDYVSVEYNGDCSEVTVDSGETTGTTITGDNLGKFTIEVHTKDGNTTEYPVSLNFGDKDYIYNVLGSDPLGGSAPLFVEEVYDYAIKEMSEKVDAYVPINNIEESTGGNDEPTSSGEMVNPTHHQGNESTTSQAGDEAPVGGNNEDEPTEVPLQAPRGVGDGSASFVINTGKLTADSGLNDYKFAYRCATTPWIVSQATTKFNTADSSSTASVMALFRAYTLSDGNGANSEVKLSIQNIKPDSKTFDLVVRPMQDSDSAPVILEKFSSCNLIKGSKNYVALKVGTIDGAYELKSKFIALEMNADEDLIADSVPCGFMGYELHNYTDTGVTNFPVSYNTTFDYNIKPKRQYFGLSTKTGVDVDILKFKGNNVVLSNGFHLDSILNQCNNEASVIGYNGTADTYVFSAVEGTTGRADKSARIPRILTEEYMKDTIYADVNVRKFTVCFYGGFDGWDIYRANRTNTDDFKATKYVGTTYTGISETEATLDLPVNAINSDYYAYLAAYRQFANPEGVDINIFATPGIDWENNELLVEDALDVIEDPDDGRGGDALYIITSPNKEAGKSDAATASEVADKLEDTSIDSSYAATYWPWVKFFDANENIYINLPVTKDVVRNLAYTDNTSYPWFAPAGINRGDINCVKATYKTKLADEDTLYNARINPVKTFAVEGAKIWGNKTIYTVDSPLNRVNVRRLMIRVKKLVSSSAKQLIFDQYDDTLKNQFLSLVDPILSSVKSNRGIHDYKIIVDDSPEARDAHTLPCTIKIKPTPTLEYIDLTFTIYPESVSFDE